MVKDVLTQTKTVSCVQFFQGLCGYWDCAGFPHPFSNYLETRANSEEHETIIMLRHEANAAKQKVAKKEKLVEDLRAEK